MVTTRDYTSIIDDIQQGYTDPPLASVVEDNIDISVYMGPSDAFDVINDRLFPNDRARQYDVLSLEIELTNSTETNYVIGEVVGRGHNIKPREGSTFRSDWPEQDIITIDIDNELTEAQRDSDEITRAFTGVISNASRLGSDRFEFMAFWPGFNELQNSEVIVSPPPGLVSAEMVDYSSRRILISRLARSIGVRLTLDTPFTYNINVAPGGVVVGTRPNGTEITAGSDLEVTVDSWRMPITTENSDGLLTRIEEASNSIWDVDRWGNFYFGAPQPSSHKLRYITETSAGLQSPAWRSVRVIGDGVVSEDGWSNSALINERPIAIKENIDDSDIDEGLAEPTFTYRNMEINTQAEAREVKNKILEELREQMASGEIRVVGHPEVWPGDAVEMPDSRNQPFGLERFLVKKVTHRINSSDGFLTIIEVGGITNAAETTFEDEIPEPDKRYDSEYSQVELDVIQEGAGL